MKKQFDAHIAPGIKWNLINFEMSLTRLAVNAHSISVRPVDSRGSFPGAMIVSIRFPAPAPSSGRKHFLCNVGICLHYCAHFSLNSE